MTGIEYEPDRCDLVWMSFDPQRGHQQRGHRPGFVLSPRRFNRLTGLALLVPITSRVRGYPFEVKLPESAAIKGVIMVDQIRAMDWQERKPRYVGRCQDVLQEVVDKLNSIIEAQ